MTSTPVANVRLTAALTYAGRGWQVIPLHAPMIGPDSTRCSCGKLDCGSVGKHPRTLAGLKDGTTDTDTIRGWWTRWASANVGIVTGAVSGIVALDVDPRNGGNEGLAELMDTYGQLPETVEAKTGGDGLHILFKHPGQTIRSGKGKLGAGLDIKGDGGYIVAAPSQHASSNRYEWREGCQPKQIAISEMPEWLLALLVEPKPTARPPLPRSDRADDGSHWLGKALAKARSGSRNDTGYWLAQQLRDSGMSEAEAAGVMRDYQFGAPQGDKPYTLPEAMQSLRSAYGAPAREPAKGLGAPYKMPKGSYGAPDEPEATPQTPPSMGAASDLSAHLDRIMSGEISNAPMPWELMGKLTQALIPGSTTVVCGDPGVGKTFWVLEALQHWHEHGIPAAVYFIEKDRKFHTMRLLAQLESNSSLVDLKFIKENPAVVSAAMARHREKIDEIGKMIWSSPQNRTTLPKLADWVLQMSSAGKRIIVIDPITAAATGENRWTADDDFMLAAEKTITAHNASLILITHPKKGNRPGAATGHDMVAGAAYFRFCDTTIWLNKPLKPKTVMVQSRLGGTMRQTPTIFAQLLKTRNAKGGGQELAYIFGGALRFAEQGVVIKEAQGAPDEVKNDPFA